MPNASRNNSRRIRLCVVDDHALFREGLIRLLASDPRFEIVFHTGSPAEALELLSHHTVDILILDYDLDTQSAVSFVTQLKAYSFAGRILIVTAGLPDSDALELIRLGISGIFHKQDSPEDLQTSIHQVAQGRVLIDQKYLQNLVTVIAAARGSRARASRSANDPSFAFSCRASQTRRSPSSSESPRAPSNRPCSFCSISWASALAANSSSSQLKNIATSSKSVQQS